MSHQVSVVVSRGQLSSPSAGSVCMCYDLPGYHQVHIHFGKEATHEDYVLYVCVCMYVCIVFSAHVNMIVLCTDVEP